METDASLTVFIKKSSLNHLVLPGPLLWVCGSIETEISLRPSNAVYGPVAPPKIWRG
jgi:hypothetical protein